MKLIITNKFFSMSGASTVKDELGNDVYKVNGKVFSFTNKKYVTDLNDNVLYIVRNKAINFILNSAFVCDEQENIILKITRKFSFKSNYSIEGVHANYRIDGDFWGWNFKIIKDDVEIGSITRRFAFSDSFILEVDNEADAPLLIAFVIAVDNISDKSENNSNSIHFHLHND